MKNILILTLFLAVLAVRSYSYTVKEMRQDVKNYMDQIQSLSADFSLDIHGVGKQPGSSQSGKFNYISGSGTVMEYLQPMKMRVEMKENGDLYLNGEKKTGMTNAYQPGDIFFDYYLSNFDLKVIHEDTNYVYMSGYEKSADLNKRASRQRLLGLRFDKKQKVLDEIQYLGSGNDYPYDVKVFYTRVQGVPIMSVMNTRVSAFSVSVNSVWKMENIVMVKK
jgi:outer membrane lipoprotein-sorting protein